MSALVNASVYPDPSDFALPAQCASAARRIAARVCPQ